MKQNPRSCAFFGHDSIQISDIRIRPAPNADSKRGLLAFVSFVIDGVWLVNNVAIRCNEAGVRRLEWPRSHRLRNRMQYPVFRPLNRELSTHVTKVILDRFKHDPIGREIF